MAQVARIGRETTRMESAADSNSDGDVTLAQHLWTTTQLPRGFEVSSVLGRGLLRVPKANAAGIPASFTSKAMTARNGLVDHIERVKIGNARVAARDPT